VVVGVQNHYLEFYGIMMNNHYFLCQSCMV
jgi:hypothetical protein